MKSLHRSDLFAWSRFDETRNLDFNSIAWVRPQGNVLIDPLELSAHDEKHLQSLGGAALIIVTNSEHLRATESLAKTFGAKVWGPRAEKNVFRADRWLAQGEEALPGLLVHELSGSKTPGELALVLGGTTLITGDLIRGQKAGSLNLLPDAKLKDKAAAQASIKALITHSLETVLVGDGWHLFQGGRLRLAELLG